MIQWLSSALCVCVCVSLYVGSIDSKEFVLQGLAEAGKGFGKIQKPGLECD